MMFRRFTAFRVFSIAIAAMTMTLAAGLYGASASQYTPDTTTNFYGFFADGGSSSLMVGHLQSSDPTVAAELVSPQYADDFFTGFGSFTNYDFARELSYTYIDQIDEADEYMVFTGNLDFYNGVQPGYVIFLSTSQEVFILIGYHTLIDDLFGLAALTIQEGRVPVQYPGYVRMKVSDDGTLQPQSGSRPSSNTPNTAASGREFCYIEPSFAILDLNGDQLLTLDELEYWVDAVPETREMIDTMRAQGYDSVRYAGC